LAEFVYINPEWRNSTIITDSKKKLASSQLFNQYIQGLFESAKKDLTKQMEHISLSDTQPQRT
jgi:hypothetical protein